MTDPGSPPSASAEGLRRRDAITAGVLLGLAVAAAYRQSFAVPFQFDDLTAIVDNPAIHPAGLDLGSLARAAATSRPLATLSFALNHWMFGPGPVGFHAVNLLIHVLASVLTWAVARQLLAAAPGRWPAGRTQAIALVTALLFAVHPVQTQAVTYVVQRMASLGALFALLATLLWLSGWTKPRPWLLRGGALLAWLAACGCKQNFVVLPAVLLGVDAIFGRGVAGRSLKAVGLLAVITVGVGGAMALGMREVIAAEYQRLGLGPWQLLVEQPRVLVHYLSLLAWPLPSRLRVDRFWELSRTLVEWRALAATTVLAGLVGAGIAFRKRAPLAAFAVLWFLGNLVVEQSVLPVDLYFEHRLYLPSLGLLLLAAVGLDAVAGRLRVGLAVLAAPLIALAAFATDQRNARWKDPAALHAQAVDAGHGTPRSYDIVGDARLEAGDLDGAEAAFRAALARSVKDAVALANLGQVAERRGDPRGAEDLYRRAIEAEPGLRQPRVNLTLLLARAGRFGEGAAVTGAWVQQRPAEPHAWYAKGALLSYQRQHEAAREAYARAVALDPSFSAALRDRAASGLALGLWADAARDLERVVGLRPTDPQPWRELGYAREQGGDRAGALRAYDESLRLDPRQQALAQYVAGLRPAGGP